MSTALSTTMQSAREREVMDAPGSPPPTLTDALALLQDAFAPIPARGAAMWLLDALEALRSVISLRYDWDSYGAAPPSKQAAEATWQLLKDLAACHVPRPEIVPLADGGIELDWMRPGRLLVQISVAPDGGSSLFGVDEGTGEEFDGSLSEFAEPLRKLLWQYAYH